MDDKDFMIEQQKAVQRMKEFANRSSSLHNDGNMPPAPHFVSFNKSEKQNNETKPIDQIFNFGKSGLDIPLLNKLKTDKDSGLILALILILLCENTDKLTLIALLYILL